MSTSPGRGAGRSTRGTWARVSEGERQRDPAENEGSPDAESRRHRLAEEGDSAGGRENGRGELDERGAHGSELGERRVPERVADPRRDRPRRDREERSFRRE